MPQLQPTVLKDRQDPQVEHTFLPRDIEKGVGSLAVSSGVPIGDNRLTISLNQTSTGRYKPRLQLAVPIVETQTINGVDSPKITRVAYCDLQFTFADTSSEEERNDVVGLLASALEPGKTLINDVIVKLQGVY